MSEKRTPELVSVVMPAFNAARTVRRAVESALAQQGVAVEILVVDDGSTDATRQEISAIRDPRLRLIQGTHQGVAHARNVALQESNGEFVAFLDADDEWLPHKLATQLPLFRADDDVQAVGSYMQYRDNRGRIMGVIGEDFDQASILSARVMPFSTPSLVVRATAIELAGRFRETLDQIGSGQAEDLDLLSRIAQLGSIRMVDSCLGFVLLSDSSTTARQFHAQRTAIRYVQACASARSQLQPEPSIEFFLLAYKPRFRERYKEIAMHSYRRASRSFAERRYARAGVYFAVSLTLMPLYTVRRTRRIVAGPKKRQSIER